MAIDKTAVIRAQALLDQHRKAAGLEGDGETIMLHVLADLIEWSDANRVDLAAQIEAAREMLRECGQSSSEDLPSVSRASHCS